MSTGTILSNVEFAQAAKRVGMPTRKLSIGISRVEGIPRRCHPYVEALVTSNTVFGASRKTFTTTMRKFCRTANFDEKFTLKVYAKTSAVVLTVKNYQRGIAGKDIGSCVLRSTHRGTPSLLRPRMSSRTPRPGTTAGMARASRRNLRRSVT